MVIIKRYDHCNSHSRDLRLMWYHPDINPVALSIGPFSIAWYGITYLLAFAVAWWLAKRNSMRPWAPIRTGEQVESLIVYGAWGVIIGGRLGYVLFYALDKWLENPLMIVYINQGGMSFHGGLMGVCLAILIFSRKYKISFLTLGDFAAPLVPTGLMFGRIGNFINQELYGRPTDGPWAMIFPADPELLPRHPSQLYEAALEGLVLFLIINWYARKPRLQGEVAGLFLVLYGAFRFSIEFVRQPDAQFAGQSALLESFNWMTRGQTLCIPMMLLGLWLMRKSFGPVETRIGGKR